MAQLPPKIPNMSPNWSTFGHQKRPSMSTFFPTSAAMHQPSWVDEFLDFSALKRVVHRRSVSDPAAVMDNPLEGEMPEFDRLDDHHLMSMFPDDVAVAEPPQEHSLSPSDQNSNSEREQKKKKKREVVENEMGEAQSECSAEEPPAPAPTESVVDPKRVKRILANRQSAQRSRMRKMQYMSELERRVAYLQTEVSALSPQVAFLDHQRSVLTANNSALRQRLAVLNQDKIFKDAQQEALKREAERLNQVYHQQNFRRMDAAGTTIATATAEPTLCTGNELVG